MRMLYLMFGELPVRKAFRHIGFIILLGLGTGDAFANDEHFFEQKVRPILVEHCLKCHGPTKQKGELRLDSAAFLLKGGEHGAVIKTDALGESPLLLAIRREGELQMPPKESLSLEDIETLSQWVFAGAPWPEHVESLRKASKVFTEKERAWWSFQPLMHPEIPIQHNDT